MKKAVILLALLISSSVASAQAHEYARGQYSNRIISYTGDVPPPGRPLAAASPYQSEPYYPGHPKLEPAYQSEPFYPGHPKLEPAYQTEPFYAGHPKLEPAYQTEPFYPGHPKLEPAFQTEPFYPGHNELEPGYQTDPYIPRNPYLEPTGIATTDPAEFDPSGPGVLRDCVSSTAATGVQSYSSDRTWQDAEPQAPPRNQDAGLGRTFRTGTQGQGGMNAADLPAAQQGVLAIGSGFNRDACYRWGSGGFPSSGGTRSFGGAALPPCATSTVDLDVAERW